MCLRFFKLYNFGSKTGLLCKCALSVVSLTVQKCPSKRFLLLLLCGVRYLWSLSLYSSHAVGAVDDGVLWNLLTCVEPTARADDAAAGKDHITAHIG